MEANGDHSTYKAPLATVNTTTNGGTMTITTTTIDPSAEDHGSISTSLARLSTDPPKPTNGIVKAEKEEGVPENGNGAAGTSASTNGHHHPAPQPAAVATEEDDEEDEDGAQVMKVDEPVDEEGADEEEALFVELEKEVEGDIKGEFQQPKDYHAAPKLLQKALETGAIKADESEEESDREHGAEAAAAAAAASASEAAAASASHHIHGRQQQLDLLLNKASQYSNFIAKDLEDLQASMTEEAIRQISKEGGSKKKRKGDKKSPSASASASAGSKKVKGEDGAARAVASALAPAAATNGGTTPAASARPVFIQPPNLAKDCVLKNYQLEGVRWLASLFENGVSGILADEMGLGKTIQCVALIAHLLTRDVNGPFLIVAPLATLPNWVREFEKWLPTRPVLRFHGTALEREAMFNGPLNPKNRRNPDFPFIVTSYETAIRDRAKLQKLAEFTYVIVDEGHRLKNHRCCLISALKKIKASNRLLLTGTPIQNTLDELWSLLNFVNPAIFDDLTVFQRWFGFRDIGQKTQETDILLEQRKNQTVSKLHEILRPFLLRRVKTDVLSDLPPKREVIVYSGMSKLQEGYAAMIEDETLRDTLIRQGIEDGRTLSHTNKQMNHRKNINHPFLFGEPKDPSTGVHMGTAHPELLVRASGKFALLDRMLERLHLDGHQVLIFSQMTRVLNVMEDYLRFRGWRFCRIDGSTNVDERQRQMDVFNAEKTSGLDGNRNEADDRNFVFLLSTRAGGLGINLTAADTCILFDSDFNPFNDSQAMDRCHRLGQTQPVAVYRLLTVNSVDIEMMERQISKKKLERMTIAGGDFRRAGTRSKGGLSFEYLSKLLESDVKDMSSKGVEDIRISDEEFEMIMDRKRLFADGANAIPMDGKMYSVIEAASGDLLGSMNSTTDAPASSVDGAGGDPDKE